MKHAVFPIAFRVVTVIWATAIGGLLGANIAGTVGSLLSLANNVDSSNVAPTAQGWMHTGWYAGSLLCCVGSITGMMRWKLGRNGGRPVIFRKRTREPVANSSSTLVEKGSVWEWVLGFGLLGGLLGTFLGGSLLLIGFSLAASPFASQDWGHSQALSGQPRQLGAPPPGAVQTKNPLAVKLLLVPALGGLAAGASLGTTLGLISRSRARRHQLLGKQPTQ